MIGALALLIIGLVIFGTAGWFGDRSTFISYFEESAHGLEVGADVKFQGVPVGRVTDLAIEVDMGDRTYRVPVTYRIDMSQVTTEGGRVVRLDDSDVLRRQIATGLRAQLKLESFVTGLLYVELTFERDPPPPEPPPRNAPYPVIPTTSSFFASLTDEAGALLADVQELDIGRISENLTLLLLRANQKLEQLDVAAINHSLLQTSTAVEELARAPELRSAMRELPGMTAQFNATMADVQSLVQRFGVVADSLQPQMAEANEEILLTLRAMREAATETQGLFSSNYGIGYQMEEALANMSRAAQALELLLAQLEQNPAMFIRGRTPEND